MLLSVPLVSFFYFWIYQWIFGSYFLLREKDLLANVWFLYLQVVLIGSTSYFSCSLKTLGLVTRGLLVLFTLKWVLEGVDTQSQKTVSCI